MPEYLERFDALAPEMELWVMAEFAPPRGRWIRYHVSRSFADNVRLLQASLEGKQVRFAAVFQQPKMPYWRLRALSLFARARLLLVYNETLDHFPLHPRALPAMVRYAAWRTRNFVRWQSQPGSSIYTFVWRLFHPRAFWRPWLYKRAKWAGKLAQWQKQFASSEPAVPVQQRLPEGISVVVPSRDGRDLLERLLPPVLADLDGVPHEIIVVDNGSSDGTAAWLRANYPQIRVQVHPEPLSFARAVNHGIDAARYAHVCLLNNDMVVSPRFFESLWRAFEAVPELFCATAQIFFPEGKRREETGKAVMPEIPKNRQGDPWFPVTCDLPVAGENHSYVLYGSGGCSLYDTAKLRALGGFDEVYEPAYVEDLDVGYRGWQRGWPTVFVADAQLVHDHRSTTSRYYSEDELELVLERNYLRFLARCVSSPELFAKLWRDALSRLNIKAVWERKPAVEALRQASEVTRWVRRPGVHGLTEEEFLALGSGSVALYPGRTRTKPVVLVAAPYAPFPLSHGGAVRMFNLMRRAAAEYDQVLVTFTDELKTPPQELLDLCIEVVQVKRSGRHDLPDRGRPDVVEEFDHPAFHAVLRELMRKWKPEIAQLEFTQMAQYAPDCAGAKTILVEHDITLDLYSQLLGDRRDWELERQLARWQTFEQDAWRRMDCVVAMSRKDSRIVTGAKRTAVLINGVDLERFQPIDQEPEPRRVLFIGSFAHLPNVLAVDWFLREAWPQVRARGGVLHIVAGSRHRYFLDLYADRVQPELAQDGIEVEDFVADVRPAYARAAVVIAPLQASAGTNIKIMEAMAMKKAIVSTSGGVNGLEVIAGRDYLHADTGRDFAHSIVELFEDQSLRREIENHARKTAVSRYSWDRIAVEQSRLYESLRRSD
jgi:O-antigen biosynthesis protein